MKKSLLFASMLAMAVSASAFSDGSTYEEIDGITFTSKWCVGQNYPASQFANAFDNLFDGNGARTATIAKINGKEKVLVTKTEAAEEGTGKSYGTLTIIDMFTGQFESKVQLSHDGTPFEGTLCVNQVGCDNFGHVWVMGATFSPVLKKESGELVSNPIVCYEITDFKTGECTPAFTVNLPVDEAASSGRLDYYDIVGDITRKEAACVLMTPVASGTNRDVYGWRFEQGADEYELIMSDGDYVSGIMEETYPADQANWGLAPTVKILADDDFTGELFYVDGFTTCPTLYNTSGTMIESFAMAKDLAPKVGTNGVTEFSLNDTPYIFYSIEQYDSGETCRARICQLGEGSAFDGMKEMWTFPKNGLGKTSDGGTRYHACNVAKFTDESGTEGVYVLTYKCMNGMAVYTMAPAEWTDPDNGVGQIIADQTNAPVEYFNLNGVRVNNDNLVPGLYITRQGNKTAKVVVK